jgi:hypothetical protein
MENKKGCECKEHYNKTNKERDGGIVSVRMVSINEKGEEMGKKKPTVRELLNNPSEVAIYLIDENGKFHERFRKKIEPKKD